MPLIAQLKPRRQEKWTEVIPEEGESLLLPTGTLPGWWEAGFSVPEEEWQRTARMSRFHLMYDRACRLLARREHFGRELQRKLSQNNREHDLVDEVLRLCRERGFIDEERAAQTASEQLLAKGAIGAPRLMQELLRRGCERDLAQRMVQEHCGGVDSFSSALELLEGRRRTYEGKLQQYQRRLGEATDRATEMQIRAKLSASMLSFLAGRGFTDSESRQAVREFCGRIMGQDPD
ncbi:MAG: regulatory protein RecX [bacterium]